MSSWSICRAAGRARLAGVSSHHGLCQQTSDKDAGWGVTSWVGRVPETLSEILPIQDSKAAVLDFTLGGFHRKQSRRRKWLGFHGFLHPLALRVLQVVLLGHISGRG